EVRDPFTIPSRQISVLSRTRVQGEKLHGKLPDPGSRWQFCSLRRSFRVAQIAIERGPHDKAGPNPELPARFAGCSLPPIDTFPRIAMTGEAMVISTLMAAIQSTTQ